MRNSILERYNKDNWKYIDKRWAGEEEKNSKFELSGDDIKLLREWRMGVWVFDDKEGFGYEIFTKTCNLWCWCKDLYPVDDKREDKYYYNGASYVIYDKLGYRLYLQNRVAKLPGDDNEIFSQFDVGYARNLVIEKGEDYFVFGTCCGRRDRLTSDGIFEEIDENNKVLSTQRRIELIK